MHFQHLRDVSALTFRPLLLEVSCMDARLEREREICRARCNPTHRRSNCAAVGIATVVINNLEGSDAVFLSNTTLDAGRMGEERRGEKDEGLPVLESPSLVIEAHTLDT